MGQVGPGLLGQWYHHQEMEQDQSVRSETLPNPGCELKN